MPDDQVPGLNDERSYLIGGRTWMRRWLLAFYRILIWLRLLGGGMEKDVEMCWYSVRNGLALQGALESFDGAYMR
jgi:hypothetical protein